MSLSPRVIDVHFCGSQGCFGASAQLNPGRHQGINCAVTTCIVATLAPQRPPGLSVSL